MQAPQNLVSDKPPFKSLLTTIAVVFLGFAVVGPVLGAIVASLFYDGDFMKDFTSFETNPGMFYAIMALQAVGTIVGLIVFPCIQLKFLEQKSLRRFFPYQYKLLFVLFLVALVAFNFIVVISPIVEWNANVDFPDFLGGFEQWAKDKETQLAKYTEAVTQFSTIQDMLLGLFVIALLPAVGEELVFRGMIQNELWRGTKNIHLSIWIAAIIFSAIHIQFYGFVPRVLLGALFGYLYYWSGNLIVPMFAHFFNNGFSVVAVYLNQKDLIETDVEEIDSAPFPAVIFCAVLTSLLLLYLWRFFRQYQSNFNADQNTL